LRGKEPADDALIAAMRSKGRTIIFVEPNSDEDHYLNLIGANANVGGLRLDHILLRADPRMIEAWEEFLHGTQRKCGLIRDTQAMRTAEIHVKRFMSRHRRLIGLSDEDAAVLERMAEAIEADD
jgi:hypothetical protein